jgi:hypothetical protein
LPFLGKLYLPPENLFELNGKQVLAFGTLVLVRLKTLASLLFHISHPSISENHGINSQVKTLETFRPIQCTKKPNDSVIVDWKLCFA